MRLTHPFADVLGLLADGLGVADGVVRDGGEELLLVLAIKRWLTHQHLIQEHPIGPPGIVILTIIMIIARKYRLHSPVYTGAVGLIVDNLRSYVVRGPAKCLEKFI